MNTQDAKAWQRTFAGLDQEPYDRNHPGPSDLDRFIRIATERCSRYASDEEIESIAQTVWVHCLKRRRDVAARLHETDVPANYLTGVVRRVKIDRYRHNRHDALTHIQKVSERDIDLPAEDLLAAIDSRADVQSALSSLPDADQIILRRKYIEEEDASQIAADLGIPLDTFYKRLERARVRLAARLACDECRDGVLASAAPTYPKEMPHPRPWGSGRLAAPDCPPRGNGALLYSE
jgi:RNA polymerase sigma factor (sigma-70 family)